MEAEKKAKEFILKFAFKGAQHEGEAKQFALILIDEVLSLYWEHDTKTRDFYKKVKQEIEKL